MNNSTAELHIRAVVRDVLTEDAADALLANESWLDEQIRQLYHAIAEINAGEAPAQSADAEIENRGMASYAAELQSQLRATRAPVELLPIERD